MNDSLLAYFGHHRCASNWILAVVNEVGSLMGLRVSNGLHRPQLFNCDLHSYVNKHRLDFLCYTNADYAFVRELFDIKGFHVIRDPRDILISSYYSHLYSHSTDGWPELAAHRERLHAATKEEGILLEMDFRAWEFKHLASWDYTRPNILEMKLEEMSASPADAFSRIFRFLGLLAEPDGHNSRPELVDLLKANINRLHFKSRGAIPVRLRQRRLSGKQLDRIVSRHSFTRLTRGRKKGEEDVTSHYRKGEAGDWRNHFSDEIESAFKNRYQDLLETLGYESNQNWTR